MLNFMEYWTGNILSDIFYQEHMINFRTKLAVILVDSELNNDDIRNRDLSLDEDDNTDPADFMILDDPPKKTKLSNSSSKVKLVSPSLVLLPPLDPTKANLMESSKVEPLSLSLGLSPSFKPTNSDLIDELCLRISMVDDVQSLDTEWVKSSNPYPIRLTLRQIRNILKVDEYMDAHCFNMAVRILACHDIQLVRDIPVHYMDLNFCWMSQYARDPRRNEKLDITKLSHLFNCWPDSNEYHISECNMILLPCDTFGLFQLFVLDQNKKVVTILDPLPIPGMGKNIFKTMVKNLNHSLRHANPAFNEDLFNWGCKVPVVPTNSNGLFGFQFYALLV
ncbi:uncharacterized protein [Lolium perenne]|uniref:uncharacterized protein isoform X2 n=1 Tax=Lolium perenne TaxID=4522 RepID=UPI0021F5787E|nr:uncharacterized protein LOC127319523 isoform X2 [Lolium perenne]